MEKLLFGRKSKLIGKLLKNVSQGRFKKIASLFRKKKSYLDYSDRKKITISL